MPLPRASLPDWCCGPKCPQRAREQDTLPPTCSQTDTLSLEAGQGQAQARVPGCCFSSEPRWQASLPGTQPCFPRAQITGKKLAGVWWWGAGEGGDLPSWAPTFLAPTPLLHSQESGSGAELAGASAPGGQGHRLPHTYTTPPPADSVWPAQGVFVCVCSSTSLAGSLAVLNPFQTRGALSRHHDEAESEAAWAGHWPFSLFHTPTPQRSCSPVYMKPLEPPPPKQPDRA